MKGRFFLFVFTTASAYLASCQSAKQPTTGSASIVGKYWKLIELNGETVPPAEQSGRVPHMVLDAAEKRVNGNGGCNSFFGGYEIQGGNGITFSKIGSTRMACPNGVMQVENRLFQAFESAAKFTLINDTLSLTKTDMSPLAKFVVGDMR